MDLKTYLGKEGRGAGKELANRLNLTGVYLSQLAARQKLRTGQPREPSPALCVLIERATDGKVTRRDLRPNDWAAIWPELVERAGV